MFNRADGTVTISLSLFPQPQTWQGSSGVPVKRTLTDSTSSGVSESVVSRGGGRGSRVSVPPEPRTVLLAKHSGGLALSIVSQNIFRRRSCLKFSKLSWLWRVPCIIYFWQLPENGRLSINIFRVIGVWLHIYIKYAAFIYNTPCICAAIYTPFPHIV